MEKPLLTVPAHGHYQSHLQQQTLFQAATAISLLVVVGVFGTCNFNCSWKWRWFCRFYYIRSRDHRIKRRRSRFYCYRTVCNGANHKMIYEKTLIVSFCCIPYLLNHSLLSLTTGTLSSTTNTTTSISETITSTDYFGNSYEYTVTGLGVTTDGSVANRYNECYRDNKRESQTWTGLNLSTDNKPVFTLSRSNFWKRISFFHGKLSSHQDGVSNVTTIQRNIKSTSVVTSTYSVLSVILLSPTQVLANAVSQSNNGSRLRIWLIQTLRAI